MYRFFLLLLAFASLAVWAQEPVVLLSADDDITDITTLDDVEGETFETLHEVLAELQSNPIDLNTATREELEQLPFITGEQIEDIQEYIYRYGGMQSVGELAMIPSIDATTRERLLRYVVVRNGGNGVNGSYGRNGNYGSNGGGRSFASHELLGTMKVPFYQRHGDDGGYLGYPYRHSLRYTFNGGAHLRAGFVASQDAGEPFFAGDNRLGYDHYSFFVQMRRYGRLKSLTVGRYRLHFGLGLAMNNDFGLGKLVSLNMLDRSYTVVRGHSSRMEYNYLQGAAATFSLSAAVDLTVFASSRRLDATLNDDGTIRTLLTSGYHRTQSEMERKHNVREQLAGGRLTWRSGSWRLGATAFYDGFDRKLEPITTSHPTPITSRYREIYPVGQHFWNASVDYGYSSRLFTVSGETATGSCGGVATLNTVSVKPIGGLRLMAVQRFYSKRYYSLHSESLSEGSRVQNESGVLVGAQWQPMRRLSLTAYTDYIYFPWARYGVSQSSHAWDNLISGRCVIGDGRWSVSARYRLRLKEEDDSEERAPRTSHLVSRIEHRLRGAVVYKGAALSLRTQLDACDSKREQRDDSFGWMVSEAVGYRHGRFSADALVAYFHTADYDSRLYVYERGMRYSLSFPMLYGHGLRYMAMGKVMLGDWCLVMKVGVTNYFDRSSIGTGLQQIDHSHQTDGELQVVWRF